ncbi:M2 family metallopeptidase [Myxococcota bacterium]
MRPSSSLVFTLAKGTLASVMLCGCSATPGPGTDRGPATVAEAEEFMATMDKELAELYIESDKMAWVQATYINEDTDWLAARAGEKVMAAVRGLVDASRRYEGLDLPEASARKLRLLKLKLSAPAPADPVERRELAEIRSFLISTYGTGKYCPAGEAVAAADCLDLIALSKIMAESRDYDRLLEVWRGWRQVSPPMRDKYVRFVDLANRGAQEMGFADLGDLWRSRYDMSPAEFEAEAERLWQQVRPLYEALHCYVRRRLSDYYGTERVPPKGPIPAHLLGNMWAQEWSNIYDLVAPHPKAEGLDVTAKLVEKKYDAERMVRQAEAFFVSLGLPELPETFWTRSMFVKPRDRDVVCHASAWEMGGFGDVRIKMCTEVTAEDFFTVHHELGHIYYYVLYKDLPILFQDGAHDGFHEGIGDTLMLSVTPQYLVDIGLFDEAPTSSEAELNVLMRRALDKVAFLPFGKMIDQWRWEVFDGRIPADKYNEGWWRLRTQYQGIVPPTARTENDFDPGAKFHIPNNTPYTRYFLAHVMQYQFHRALCRAAGYEGPLHTCSIAGSKEAGEKLGAMLRMGATGPWPETLQVIAGESEMDAKALLEYFAPLRTYLDKENAGQSCGW